MHIKKLFFYILIIYFNLSFSSIGIYNQTFTTQLGDHISTYALAKILSLKYNIPFYYVPFKYSDLFEFDVSEILLDRNKFKREIQVYTEKDITDNINEDSILFYTNFQTKIDCIDKNWIDILKKFIKLKEIPKVNDLPIEILTIAVHIRKANGGGERDEGNQISKQIFEFDRNKVKYIFINNFEQFAFDWMTDIRFKNNSYYTDYPLDYGCPIKYAPDQYYVDQIKKISEDLNNIPIYVQIFTDDRNPISLKKRIKKAVNKKNIIFHYENNRKYSYREQMAQDLYNISRFDILIRSHSYFCKTAELMGNHKLIIFPIGYQWLENNRLIMNKVIIKANLYSDKCPIIENNPNYINLFKDKHLINNEKKNKDGWTSLHFAASCGNINLMKSLMHTCLDINERDNNGNTPLMLAIINNQIDIIRFLLEKKSNLQIKNSKGQDAFNLSKQNGDQNIINLINYANSLFKYLNEFNNLFSAINKPNKDGKTLLRIALENKDYDAVNALLELGANPKDEGTHGDYLTPLHIAAEHNIVTVIKLILNKYPELVDYQGTLDMTPLRVSVTLGHNESIEILLNYGANPNIKNKDYLSAKDILINREGLSKFIRSDLKEKIIS